MTDVLPPSPEPPEAHIESPLESRVVTIKPPSPESLWAELVIAANYLTRLNLPLKDTPQSVFIGKAMGWFPLIGVLIGLFGASIDWIMSQIGMPGLITSTFAIIGMLWMTRALHEEEMASLINEYGRAIDREQKIGWLREERSVRYGTLGVILVIIMKIGALASFESNDSVFQALIASCALSRGLMVAAAAWLRPLPGDPVADYFQQPPAMSVVLALGLAAAVLFAVLGTDMAMTFGIGVIAGLIVALIGAHHLRGYNGPLLGTLQQVVELAVLGAVLAIQ
jgi:adenosylcobinamide-GDP ribazoletransferase